MYTTHDLLSKHTQFVHTHGRTLEQALFQAVLDQIQPPAPEVLHDHRSLLKDQIVSFQNPDGGFGGGIEPDCWNPNSSPMQTLHALQLLIEWDLMVPKDALSQTIGRYLCAGQGFREGRWLFSIPSNDLYPHAPWWSWNEQHVPFLNPSLSLAAFLWCYMPEGSKEERFGRALFEDLMRLWEQGEAVDLHDLLELTWTLQLLQRHGKALERIPAWRQNLKRQIQQVMLHDPDDWFSSYTLTPDEIALLDPSLIDPGDVTNWLKRQQLRMRPDGSFPLTFSWGLCYPEASAQAVHWWTCRKMAQYHQLTTLYTSPQRAF